eukprot:m51a1_g9236 hypothetical protein (424) ;mRNA; f:92585-94261
MTFRVHSEGTTTPKHYASSSRVVHHMRFHLLAALLVAVAAAVVVAAVTFEYTSAAELRTLERRQAVEEATLFYEILDNELATLDLEIVNLAWQNDIYQYIVDGDPQGSYWTSYYNGDPSFMNWANLVAMLFMFPNGTLINGMMWNANHTDAIRPSPVFTQQISSMLLSRGKSDGLFWIPEIEALVIAQSQHVLHINLTGPPMGWVVYARSPFAIISKMVDTTNVCAALLPNTTDFGSIASVWDGEHLKMKGQIRGTRAPALAAAKSTPILQLNAVRAERNVGHVVAPASVFEKAGMTCSVSENQTHDTYLAIGTVIDDEMGVPRISILLRGIRVDAPTISSTTRYLIIICCCSLFALLCLVAVLLEIFVIRVLSTLSWKIVSVSSNMNPGERLKLTGKHELRNVTRTVNKLLVALEHRTEYED